MGRKRDKVVDPDAWKKTMVMPTDSLEIVVVKMREEASWFPDDGKTAQLLLRGADAIEFLLGVIRGHTAGLDVDTSGL